MDQKNDSTALIDRIESEPCFTLSQIREYLAIAEADLATTTEIIDVARSYALKSVRGELRRIKA